MAGIPPFKSKKVLDITEKEIKYSLSVDVKRNNKNKCEGALRCSKGY